MLTAWATFDILVDNSLTSDVKAVVKRDVKDVKDFSQMIWRNEYFGIPSVDIPRDSRGDPSGAATLEVELNYSAQKAARDLRFEKYSSP